MSAPPPPEGTFPFAPPQDLEAEQSVLGAVLLSDAALPALTVDEDLEPEDFYRASYGTIYRTMIELQAEGEPVDVITLTDRLRADRTLEQVGGRSAVEFLAGSVPGVANVRAYARTVKRLAVWRRRISASYEMLSAGHMLDDDAWNYGIAAADNAEKQVVHKLSAHDSFWTWFNSDRVGWPSPYERLTKALGGGLIPGDVTVIGGWPGHRKSVLADMFVNACDKAEGRAHVLFNELQQAQRIGRYIAQHSDVPWPALQARRLSDVQRAEAEALTRQMPERYTEITDWPVERVCQAIRRGRWDVVVVDQATLIPAKDAQEYKHVSNSLARVAMETKTHVIEVCQLNLERAKQAQRPKPTGRDLLGTGAWFSDAKNVLFSYAVQDKDGVEQLEGLVYADKDTHGNKAAAHLDVMFRPEWMRLDEQAPDYVADSEQLAEYRRSANGNGNGHRNGNGASGNGHGQIGHDGEQIPF